MKEKMKVMEEILEHFCKFKGIKYEKDYEELLQLLNNHEVKYIIIGAHIIIYYTKPNRIVIMNFVDGENWK